MSSGDFNLLRTLSKVDDVTPSRVRHRDCSTQWSVSDCVFSLGRLISGVDIVESSTESEYDTQAASNLSEPVPILPCVAPNDFFSVLKQEDSGPVKSL